MDKRSETRKDGKASMTIEQMRERKQELGYTYEQIADLSGVPLGTVQKVFGGVTASPRYDTLRALEQVFQKKEPMYVKESAPPYEAEVRREKRQGEYTVEDYRALPEEQRMELIDGVLYDMAAPTGIHQLIGGEIYAVLRDYIRTQKGKCLPMYAPIDVQLDCDDKTIVQPDVLVLCDVRKLSGNTISGAPDFIVEILSPSTRKKDMFIKLEKYMTAGVREYWMVDAEKKKVLIYDFEHENYPILFGFDAEVPVGIFEGQCKVDFGEIYEYLRSFSLVD